MQEEKNFNKLLMESGVEAITGVRPTGNLIVADYLTAVLPLLNLQKQGFNSIIFVADLHALAENESNVIKYYNREIVIDCLALGIDPNKTTIYLQSDIAGELGILNILLARHTSVAELLRISALEGKQKQNTRPEIVNTLLLLYPVLMAANILIQQAKQVSIDKSQVAHLELIQLLAKRFNNQYGAVFPIPKSLQKEPRQILSLKGEGKMSRNNPNGALFLSDSPEFIAQKIKIAETAFAGEMSDKLTSHLVIAKGLSSSKEQRNALEKIIKEHKRGEAVMKEFKQLFTEITQEFVVNFQARKIEISAQPEYVDEILVQGKKRAQSIANKTLTMIYKAIYK